MRNIRPLLLLHISVKPIKCTCYYSTSRLLFFLKFLKIYKTTVSWKLLPRCYPYLSIPVSLYQWSITRYPVRTANRSVHSKTSGDCRVQLPTIFSRLFWAADVKTSTAKPQERIFIQGLPDFFNFVLRHIIITEPTPHLATRRTYVSSTKLPIL